MTMMDDIRFEERAGISEPKWLITVQPWMLLEYWPYKSTETVIKLLLVALWTGKRVINQLTIRTHTTGNVIHLSVAYDEVITCAEFEYLKSALDVARACQTKITASNTCYVLDQGVSILIPSKFQHLMKQCLKAEVRGKPYLTIILINMHHDMFQMKGTAIIMCNEMSATSENSLSMTPISKFSVKSSNQHLQIQLGAYRKDWIEAYIQHAQHVIYCVGQRGYARCQDHKWTENGTICLQKA